MVHFMQSCVTCSNTSLKILSHLALQRVFVSFNYITYFILDAKPLLKVLDEKRFNKVSFIKDVLYDIKNVCNLSFLV